MIFLHRITNHPRVKRFLDWALSPPDQYSSRLIWTRPPQLVLEEAPSNVNVTHMIAKYPDYCRLMTDPPHTDPYAIL